jgi:two-component system chemotaxis response regulator CheB
MKILVVDDSIVYRAAIHKALEGAEGITALATAHNGKVAVDRLKNEKFDLMTIDIEMPIMDGISAILEIRKFNKSIPIIVFSTLTLKGAEKTMEALQAGANDFCPKVEGEIGDMESGIRLIREELLPRIQALGSRKVIPIINSQPDSQSLKNFIVERPLALCIGSSTGGPEALKAVFSNLKGPFKFPIFMVQHMPPLFTTQLAMMLSKVSGLNVVEAKDGEIVSTNKIYLAPGDFHMKVVPKGNDLSIQLNQGDKVCYVRPAVNVLLDSLVELYGRKCPAIILTGMGEDGLNGAKKIKASGGKVFIQDKESSVVWGMPGAIAALNLQDETLTLAEIGKLINTMNGV